MFLPRKEHYNLPVPFLYPHVSADPFTAYKTLIGAQQPHVYCGAHYPPSKKYWESRPLLVSSRKNHLTHSSVTRTRVLSPLHTLAPSPRSMSATRRVFIDFCTCRADTVLTSNEIVGVRAKGITLHWTEILDQNIRT